MKIDTKLAGPLFTLPGESGSDTPKLARRNLLRGFRLNLPAGELVARAMGESPLAREELDLDDLGFRGPTPLWYYVLREAEIRQDGARLGPVGGRIVAEVFAGLLEGDPLSYLSVQPDWRPELRAETKDDFTMADLIRFAAPEDAVRHSGREPS